MLRLCLIQFTHFKETNDLLLYIFNAIALIENYFYVLSLFAK